MYQKTGTFAHRRSLQQASPASRPRQLHLDADAVGIRCPRCDLGRETSATSAPEGRYRRRWQVIGSKGPWMVTKYICGIFGLFDWMLLALGVVGMFVTYTSCLMKMLPNLLHNKTSHTSPLPTFCPFLQQIPETKPMSPPPVSTANPPTIPSPHHRTSRSTWPSLPLPPRSSQPTKQTRHRQPSL